MATFLITFRETLEAALIIWLILSIISGFEWKFKNNLYIISAIILWIIFSFVFAYFFNYFLWWFEWKSEKIYEWILMFIAFIMISHLILWSNKNTAKIKSKIKNAVLKKEILVLFIIAFVSVVREWVETVIFLNALDLSLNINSMILWILGIVSAAFLSFILFSYLKKINISLLFKFTNFLLLFIAWWLLAHSIVEFQWAWILPTFIKPLFDLSNVMSEKEWIGSFLKAIFSYDANPSLIAVIAYISYILWFSYIFYKINKKW